MLIKIAYIVVAAGAALVLIRGIALILKFLGAIALILAAFYLLGPHGNFGQISTWVTMGINKVRHIAGYKRQINNVVKSVYSNMRQYNVLIPPKQ